MKARRLILEWIGGALGHLCDQVSERDDWSADLSYSTAWLLALSPLCAGWDE